MKKVPVSRALCVVAIVSTFVTAQEHPFHQPNRGKHIVANNVATNISSVDLLPEKPMTKSNGVIPWKSTFAASGLQKNSIPDIPQSKLNFPKYFRSEISSSFNNRNVAPQRPASKRNW